MLFALRFLRRFFYVLASVALISTMGQGQETIVSNIRGIVADSSGLVVAGATAIVRNEQTGLVRETTTSASGEYVFDSLPSGNYTLEVEMVGFKKYVQTDIDLTASKTIRANAIIEVGQVSESVTVVGSSPVLETESASVSHSVRNKVMNEVPTAGSIQGGRLIHTYLHLVPGNASGGGFNGLPSGRVTLDGVAVKVGCCQTEPTLEMIDELKVITHNAPAEYSQPSTVQLTTRQGGNDFHGDVWWLYIDKSLEARDPFLAEKVVQHGHTVAWSLAGPIIKDKMFFYHGFEAQRFNNTAVSSFTIQTNSLPTAKMQGGDFSELIDPAFVNQYNSGRSIVVNDPLTGQAFVNNVIPTNRISSVSTSLVNRFYLPPNQPGLTGNHFSDALRPRKRNKPDLRVDYIVSPRHSVYGRYGHTSLRQRIPTTNIRPEHTNDIDRVFPSRTASASDIFIFSPNVTNELKVGFNRTRLAFSNAFFEEDTMASAGIVNTQGITGLLGLSFSGTGTFTGIPAQGYSNSVGENWSVADHVSIHYGKHNIKTGFQFIRSHSFNTSAITPPTFTFNGRLSGWSWADFMLGLPASISRSLASPVNYLFQNEYGMFVQDEIQVHPNLTLNVGVRYQIWPFSFEKFDRLAVFDPARQAMIVPGEATKKLVVPTFPQAAIPVLTAQEAGYAATNRALTNRDLNDVAPRFGFAWRMFGSTQTVLRGGYGLFYYNSATGGPSAGGSIFTGSQTLTQQLGSNGTLNPIMAFPDPFQPLLTGTVQTLNAQTINLAAGDPNLKTPMVHEWSLTLERGFRDWVLRGSYLGSAEKVSQFSTNINEATPGSVAFTQSRRPVPAVRDINFTQNGGSATSHAMQIVLDKRFSQGFSFNAAYTWLHKLTDLNFFGPGAAFNRERFRSNPGSVTPRQQLILTYNWEIPVGHNRQFGARLHPVVNGIIGGWRILGVGKFETGQYLTPFYTGVDPTGSTPGTGSMLPDRITDGNLPRGTRGSNAPNIPFFDTAAFVCPGGSTINGLPNLLTAGCPQSTPENIGRYGNSSPNIIETPGLNTWNMSLAKNFKLWRESTSMEIAAWISNPWNHPNWSNQNMNLSSPATVGIITSTRIAGFIEPFSLGRRRISLQMKIMF